MNWEIVHTGKATGLRNMELDAAGIRSLSSKKLPQLRFYDWEGPSATYGYFLDPFAHVDEKKQGKWGLTLARRPTGGGLMFHGTDCTFSFLVPASHPAYSENVLENYAFVNNLVIGAISHCSSLKPSLNLEAPQNSPHFCLVESTRYDVMLDGRKVGGAAQRRTRDGYLHQGSILLKPPNWEMIEDVLRMPALVSSMRANSFPLGIDKIEFMTRLEKEVYHGNS